MLHRQGDHVDKAEPLDGARLGRELDEQDVDEGGEKQGEREGPRPEGGDRRSIELAQFASPTPQTAARGGEQG